jgi:sRNA-binding protein
VSELANLYEKGDTIKLKLGSSTVDATVKKNLGYAIEVQLPTGVIRIGANDSRIVSPVADLLAIYTAAKAA